MKQTEIGLIPEDWEVKSLGEIGEPCMCKRILKEQTSPTGDIPFYKIGTFGGIPDAYISRELFEQYKEQYNYPKKGTLLLSAAGTIGRVVVFDGKDSYFQDSNIVWIDNDETKVTNDFLFYCYSRMQWKTEEGGIVSRLYNANLKSTSFIAPKSLAEQQRIAKALSDVDALISTTEKLIQKKKNIKQGAMQNLLTGKKRLPGFGDKQTDLFVPNGTHTKEVKDVSPEQIRLSAKMKQTELGEIPEDWEVKSLGEMLKIGHGKDYKNLKSGNVPVYGTGGYMTSVNDFLYEGETVCIGRKGTIDKPQYHSGKIWTVDTLFYTYDFKSLNPKYLFYKFCLIDWLSMNEASGVPSLTAKNIEDIQITIPTEEEQTAIANVLSSMDKEIETLNTKLEKYRNLKTAMMQQLLTGKIRLV
ncbi:restriction endonuclease subunit S [Treponema berlinense]|uniref:restriction endonuclease subunit S n=1 Tax=Treponema berlinense TaxID=225004 RepID=UPI003F056394